MQNGQLTQAHVVMLPTAAGAAADDVPLTKKARSEQSRSQVSSLMNMQFYTGSTSKATPPATTTTTIKPCKQGSHPSHPRTHAFPSCAWHVTKTQKEAFDWLDKQSAAQQQRLRVFAEEVTASGGRRFMVCSPERMWLEYQQLRPDVRHMYEIIRAGRRCHLYFDLEYVPAFNPSLDGDQMVQLLLEVVADVFKECFSITLKQEWILELDSSTSSKFSRHVIVQVRRAAFPHNGHVAAFVASVVQRIAELAQSDQRYASFWVWKGPTGTSKAPAVATTSNPEEAAVVEVEPQACPPQQDLFVDLSVYSRNRAFRLYLASKFGKTAVLRPTTRYGFASIANCTAKGQPPAPVLTDEVSEAIFYASLITHVDQGGSCRLLRMPGVDDGPSPDPRSLHIKAAGCGTAWPSFSHQAAGPAISCDASRIPGLDSFVQSVCAQDGAQGSIRSCMHLPDCRTLLINIRGSRWCGNIQTQHKSNGIYLVVDLECGGWHQRCFDPCCRAYRSASMPLPKDVWNSLKSLMPLAATTGPAAASPDALTAAAPAVAGLGTPVIGTASAAALPAPVAASPDALAAPAAASLDTPSVTKTASAAAPPAPVAAGVGSVAASPGALAAHAVAGLDPTSVTGAATTSAGTRPAPVAASPDALAASAEVSLPHAPPVPVNSSAGVLPASCVMQRFILAPTLDDDSDDELLCQAMDAFEAAHRLSWR